MIEHVCNESYLTFFKSPEWLSMCIIRVCPGDLLTATVPPVCNSTISSVKSSALISWHFNSLTNISKAAEATFHWNAKLFEYFYTTCNTYDCAKNHQTYLLSMEEKPFCVPKKKRKCKAKKKSFYCWYRSSSQNH